MKTEAPEQSAELAARTYDELKAWVVRFDELTTLWRSIFLTPPGAHRDTLEALAGRLGDELRTQSKFGVGNHTPLMDARRRVAALLVYEKLKDRGFGLSPGAAKTALQEFSDAYGGPELKLREWKPWLEEQFGAGHTAELYNDIRPELITPVLVTEMWDVWSAQYDALPTRAEKLAYLMVLMAVFADDPQDALIRFVSRSAQRWRQDFARRLERKGKLSRSDAVSYLEQLGLPIQPDGGRNDA